MEYHHGWFGNANAAFCRRTLGDGSENAEQRSLEKTRAMPQKTGHTWEKPNGRTTTKKCTGQESGAAVRTPEKPQRKLDEELSLHQPPRPSRRDKALGDRSFGESRKMGRTKRKCCSENMWNFCSCEGPNVISSSDSVHSKWFLEVSPDTGRTKEEMEGQCYLQVSCLVSVSAGLVTQAWGLTSLFHSKHSFCWHFCFVYN